MPLDSVLPEQLHPGDRENIENVKANRLQALFSTMGEILSECTRAADTHPLASLLVAIDRLLGDGAERSPEFVRHWCLEFLLPASQGEQAYETATRLYPSLLFERLLDGSSPLEQSQFQTRCLSDGSLPAFAHDASLFLPSVSGPGELLNWHCAQEFASVHRASDASVRARFRIPIDRTSIDPDVAVCAYPRADPWAFPVIPNGMEALFIDKGRPEFDAPRSGHAPNPRTLDLSESLGAAHQMLQDTWPEVIDWANVLIPAVADVGFAPNPNTHYSGSFGVGLPIYLSRACDSLPHSEDLVHELQHQRFHLAIPATEWFGRWKDFGFVSPYRPDPRPLSGLHLGLHAFIAVNEFRLRAIAKGRGQGIRISELLRTHRQNLFVFRTVLRHDQLSPESSHYLQSISGLLKRHSELIEPMVDNRSASEVEAKLTAHALRVTALAPDAENRAVTFEPATAAEFNGRKQVYFSGTASL